MEKVGITAQKATGSIRSQAIDLMKLILSVFVVMIHAELDLGLFTPFLRTSVPLFFITSSYFFFKKVDTCRSERERKHILAGFLKRNMQLYGFWFFLLLPVTLYIRRWFSDGFATGILRFLQSLLFNSTFRASWFLMALNIGMCITLWLSRRLSCGMQLLAVLPFYLICCLSTNYYGLAERSDTFLRAYSGYISVFSSWSNSYPAALFWLALGRWFAQGQRLRKKSRVYGLAAVSAAGLAAEYWAVNHWGWPQGNDAYVSLIGLCAAVFALVSNSRCRWERGCRFGHISTIFYTSHATVITVAGAVIRRLIPGAGALVNWVIFAAAMCICSVIVTMVFMLEKRRGFTWLRNAY